MEDFRKCRFCFEVYNETNRPLILHCGHSFCTLCLSRRIEYKMLSCPNCTTRFKASSVSDIAINYSLENCISVMSDMGLAEEYELQPKDESPNIQNLIDYQKSSAEDLVLSTKDLVKDLNAYQEYLQENIGNHRYMREKISERAKVHEKIVENMKADKISGTREKEKLDIHIQKLEAALPDLDNASSSKDVATAVARITEMYNDLATVYNECQKYYPSRQLCSYQRMLSTSMDILYMDNFKDLKGYSNFYLHQCPFDDLSIADKLALCNIEGFFTVGDLKSDTEKWKKRISNKNAYTASWDNGHRKTSPIEMKNSQVYLHCLYDGLPSPMKYVIEHKEVLTCVSNDPTLVFLDLKWDATKEGRILIKLFPGNPMAQHFKGLCTGELGPTYLNKKFSQVLQRGTTLERIKCEPCEGSFDNNSALLDTLDFGGQIHRHNADQGIIWMEKSFSFHILTGSGRDCVYNNVFGQVQEGLEVLKESVKVLGNGHHIEIFSSGILLEI